MVAVNIITFFRCYLVHSAYSRMILKAIQSSVTLSCCLATRTDRQKLTTTDGDRMKHITKVLIQTISTTIWHNVCFYFFSAETFCGQFYRSGPCSGPQTRRSLSEPVLLLSSVNGWGTDLHNVQYRWRKWKSLWSGVNFTKILRADFSYKSVLRSFYLLTIWLCNYLAKVY